MRLRDEQTAEIARYILNGFFATMLHFFVLTIAIHVFEVPSAALANFIASIFGISASFLGNRYFVFRIYSVAILPQAVSFARLYFAFAVLHAGTLAVLTDWLEVDFRIGFLIATVLQTVLSYLGNRRLVFPSLE